MQFLVAYKKILLFKSLVCVHDMCSGLCRVNTVEGYWCIIIAGLKNCRICQLCLTMFKVNVQQVKFTVPSIIHKYIESLLNISKFICQSRLPSVLIGFKPFVRFELPYHTVCHRFALGMIVLPLQLMSALPEEGMLNVN